jgi:hypothetical protein
LIGEDKSASRTIKGVGSETDKSSKKMQSFHKVGTAAGVALAGGLLLAGKAAVDMTKKAADDQQAASKLADTIHKTTGASKDQTDAVEDWITAQGKATGITDDELRPALSKLVVATHSVAKAQRLAKLAQDVSIGTGKDLGSVSTALAKAQNGNISGLSRLGIATKDADGKTKSLHAITKDLAATFGGAAAKNAETAAGKQKIMTTQMGELQEQIGAGLLPVMSKLVDVGLKVVDWISNNTRLAGIMVGVVGGLVGLVWAVSAAIKVWAAVTKLMAAYQTILNAELTLNPIGLVVIAIAALVFALIIAYKKSETFRNIVNGALHGVLNVAQAVAGFFTNKVPAAFHKVVSAAGNVLGWVKGNWPKILAVLTGPFGLAVLAIARNWDRIKAGASNAVGFLKAKFGDFLDFIRSIPGRIADMAGRFADAGKSLGSHIISGLFAGLKAIGGFAGDLAGAIKGAVNSALHLPFTIHGPGPLPDFTIPAFAKGGIVTGPTIGLIGEAGPEAVIPLGRGGHGLGSTINVNVNVSPTADKRAIGKEIVAAINAYQRIDLGVLA